MKFLRLKSKKKAVNASESNGVDETSSNALHASPGSQQLTSQGSNDLIEDNTVSVPLEEFMSCGKNHPVIGENGSRLHVDGASLINEASSTGDITRGDVTISPSVYTTMSTIDDHEYGDGCNTVSSIYQRSVLSASASVYTDVDSLKAAPADEWAHAEDFLNDHSRPLSFRTNTKSEHTLEEENSLTHFVSNEHLNDIRNLQSSHNEINQKNVTKPSRPSGNDTNDDDNDGETTRLTLSSVQLHEMKEADKINSSSFEMGSLRVGTLHNTGPIDVDEGILDEANHSFYNNAEECIARRIISLKLDDEEYRSKHRTLDRIDEDAISILSTKPFSAGTGVSPKKTQELLKSEKEREREERLKRTVIEAKEKKRSLRLKEAELLRQRNMQKEVQLRKKRIAEAQRRLKLAEENEGTAESISSSALGSTVGSNATNLDCALDTYSKKTSDIPALCIVCMEGERSHLAVPCMHFSFCEFCVQDMERRKVTRCPVCNEINIKFSKVFF